MPRTTLVFTLSSKAAQTDLVEEFALHDDVVATAIDVDGVPAVRVETRDVVTTLWDVRATVGMFDDAAVEQAGQG